MTDAAALSSDRDILDRLTAILRDVLNDERVSLAMATTRADVPGWDSFAYINFIVAAELDFGVRYRIADVERFDTLADIVAATRDRLTAKI